MREIKFRGKLIEVDEWVYGTLLRIPHPPTVLTVGEKEEDKYYIQFPNPRYLPDWNMPYQMVQGDVIPNTIGQYTGLKDKNGKEIYEGDKVYIIPEDEYGEVQWDIESARFIVVYDNIITDFDNWYGKDLEVVGTIYD